MFRSAGSKMPMVSKWRAKYDDGMLWSYFERDEEILRPYWNSEWDWGRFITGGPGGCVHVVISLAGAPHLIPAARKVCSGCTRMI